MALRRSTDAVIAGVCGGLADHVGVERMTFRTLYTANLVLFGLGVPLYVALYAIMDPAPETQDRREAIARPV